MRPELLELAGDKSDDEKIDRAARALERGGLVAFPTDTVYGLGADASREDAVERLYAVKRRDRGKPLARLVPDARAAEAALAGAGAGAGRFPPSGGFPPAGGFPRLARKLARAYWPGALTIVVGGMGFRVPDHQAARALAARLDGGLAATSANRSGGPDPRTAEDVIEALGSDVDLVLDGGKTGDKTGGEAGGVASTVVRADGERPEVLREGAIPEDDIMRLAPPTVLFVCRGNTCRSPTAAAAFAREMQAKGRTDVTVLSAGTAPDHGRGPGASTSAHEAAAEIGLDLTGHEVTALTPSLLARADWVFVMEASQIDDITSLLPEEADHVRLLDPGGRDIADPCLEDALERDPATWHDIYRRGRDAILAAVRARAAAILDETGPGGEPPAGGEGAAA